MSVADEAEFMRQLVQCVQNGLGDGARTCIDPKVQLADGKTVCLVSCQRSPEPVYLRWKGKEATPDGHLYVRSGPRPDKLSAESAAEYSDEVSQIWVKAGRN